MSRFLKNKKINVKKFKKSKKREQQREEGITLIALITTIIVLLILAGISIGAITGSNGIIGGAQSAKEETEIAQEKEIIDISTVEAMGKNNRGNLEEEEFQNVLDSHTNGNVTVSDIGEEFEVFFEESNRYYTVDKDGNILGQINAVGDKYPGDITRKEDGTVLDGSSENPYEINCIEDLVAFSNMVNRKGKVFQNGQMIDAKNSVTIGTDTYIILTTNLNFKSNASYIDSQRTDFGDINGNEGDGNALITEMTTGTGFYPIGLIGVFLGKFDGKDNVIYNIYENREGSAGLFIMVSNSTIENLTLTGEITGTDVSAGISAGGNTDSTSTIINCTNYANVEGVTMVGGIGGWKKNTTIKDCKNYGNISIKGSNISYGGAGGIVGYASISGDIENCYNEGEISGEYLCGGIIGTRRWD